MKTRRRKRTSPMKMLSKIAHQETPFDDVVTSVTGKIVFVVVADIIVAFLSLSPVDATALTITWNRFAPPDASRFNIEASRWSLTTTIKALPGDTSAKSHVTRQHSVFGSSHVRLTTDGKDGEGEEVLEGSWEAVKWAIGSLLKAESLLLLLFLFGKAKPPRTNSWKQRSKGSSSPFVDIVFVEGGACTCVVNVGDK